MNLVQEHLFADENIKSEDIVNVASVPQRSPFRYPGGKTWFIPRLREWLKSQPQIPDRLVEPFVGGGVVSLTSVAENLAKSAVMVELDSEVAAVWRLIAGGDAEWLANKILNYEMSFDNVVASIDKPAKTTKQKAFKTMLKNRCYHGGILAAGSGLLKHGEAGRGVASRWYPETLAKRLREIDVYHEKLIFKKENAFKTLEDYKNDESAVFFIDPPYTAGGKKAGSRLYKHHALDHDLLFKKCSELAGDFIMTYDNADEVKVLAQKYNLEYRPIPMRNTHHAQMNELVIGRDLTWMNAIEKALEEKAKLKSLKKKPPKYSV